MLEVASMRTLISSCDTWTPLWSAIYDRRDLHGWKGIYQFKNYFLVIQRIHLHTLSDPKSNLNFISNQELVALFTWITISISPNSCLHIPSIFCWIFSESNSCDLLLLNLRLFAGPMITRILPTNFPLLISHILIVSTDTIPSVSWILKIHYYKSLLIESQFKLYYLWLKFWNFRFET